MYCRTSLGVLLDYIKRTRIIHLKFSSFTTITPEPFVRMSIQFLYEDGKGTVVDEYGRPEPMDYIVDEEQYRLETLSSYSQYLSKVRQEDKTEAMQIEDSVKPEIDVAMRETSTKRNYTQYADQNKVRYFKLLFEKCLSASAAAKQLGIHVRTAQRWARQYERRLSTMSSTDETTF
jgi:hypothetical protein